MPAGEEPDLKREYDVNSHRGHLSAYVLIAGLLLELVAAAIWFHGVETIVTIVAVLLIVGGVWGEVYFGNKAREAGDSMLAENKARAAEAIKNVAIANARAAEANQRAAEAALALERFRTTRARIFKESDCEKRMKQSVNDFGRLNATKIKFALACNLSDGEQSELMQTLSDALTSIGWESVPWNRADVVNYFGNVSVRGVELEGPKWTKPYIDALAAMLNEVGIKATANVRDTFDTRGMPFPVRVMVGSKL